jgi:hypothetical protein
MSSVVTGRKIGMVLVGVVDFAVFLRGHVVDVEMEGLTLSARSDAGVCVIMPPRVCALRGSGVGYLWTSFFRVCWLPSPVRQVSGLSCGPGAGRRFWIFDCGLGRLQRCGAGS